MPLERDTADLAIEDRFDRQPFVNGLVDLLLDLKNHQARGFVVGLTGPWGSGKSQVMLYVEEQLRKECTLLQAAAQAASIPPKSRLAKWLDSDPPPAPQPHLIVVRFNPWLHAGQDDLLRQFFDSIREEIKKLKDPALQGVVSKLETVKGFARRFSGVLKAIPVVGAGVSEAAGAALAESSLEAEKEHFAKSLADARASVIVLVDEIDRLSDQEIREIAQAVKSVADFPMFSYLLAYDPDRVAKALGRDDTKLGYQYLEKIVQVQARLPRVDPGTLVSEIRRQIPPIALKSNDPEEADWLEAIHHLVPDIISTPRDARRLAAAIALRWPPLNDEVNPFDLLRYCALEAKVPILSERIQHRTARITVDGSRELRRRFEHMQKSPECIDEILGEYKGDKPLRDLLVYLFPALRDGGSEEITRDDDRLCYETPLLSLLNYKPVTGLISRTEARAALKCVPLDLSALLTRSLDAGRLRQAILRLRRVYRDLENANEMSAAEVTRLWTQIGAFFDRPIAPEDMPKWDSWLELTHVFVRGALRNYLKGNHITRAFVKGLLDTGQIHLPARILMFHIQAYGLSGVERDSLLIPILNEQETNELLPEASKILTDSVMNADRKWRLRSAVPLWVIAAGDADGKNWAPVRDLLTHPQKPEHLDGILVLAMRNRDEVFCGTTLPKELNIQEIAGRARALQNPEPELRTPIDVAYQYLRSQLRMTAN